MKDTAWITLEAIGLAGGWVVLWGGVFGIARGGIRNGAILSAICFVALAGNHHWPDDGPALYTTYAGLVAIPALLLLSRILTWLSGAGSRSTVQPRRRTRRPGQPGDLLIRYSYGDGKASERTISPEWVQLTTRRTGPPFVRNVHAFCHLRGAPRTFVLDKIEWAADAQSGEMVDDLQAYFHGRVSAGLPTAKPEG